MLARKINDLVLNLYRASHDVPLRHFQEHVLELTKSAVAFDSAWWGNASAEPQEIHRLHLHNCDASIVEAYPPYSEQDFFREKLIRNPGVSINLADLITRDKFVQTEMYQGLGRRYKIEWSLGTLLIEPVSSLFEFITLWRHDPEKPFDEADRTTKEMLMPHLAEAHRNARLHHLLGGGHIQGTAWALADDRAYLREVSPAFVTRLKAEWPDWQGNRLPEPLARRVIEARPYQGGGLVVDLARREGFRFLEARAPSMLERLAPREREVAELYARGRTHAEIAAALGLSPATARNHIARCFKKLGVNNKSELILLLGRHTRGDARETK